MFTNRCPICNCQPCGCKAHTCLPEPCLPSPESGECEEPVDLACMFWMADPVYGTPIKKGTRGTEVVFYLMEQIRLLENRIVELES